MNLRNTKDYIQLILGIKQNEMLGFRLLTFLARRLLPNYRFTWPELEWFDDANLTKTLVKFEENKGFNAHRKHAIQQLMRLIEGVPGDTAECGVYKGCSSYIMLHANAKSPFERDHHIFDSFEGLSQPADCDGTFWTSNDLSVSQSTVENNLADFDRVHFYKAWIPQRFIDVATKTFAFVHVDVDLYEPTLESIRFFYDKMNPGGIFVCDDYGFKTCPGATLAVQEFLASKPEKMISLAGGGGFFIKGCTTALE
jgi:O-methyltransferase